MHNLTWNDLELFLAIAQRGSLSAASQKLQVNQSTLSRRLSDLERRLGAALFVRTREGTTMTALGRAWLEPALHAERGFIEAAQAAISAQELISGEVTITAPEAISNHLIVPAMGALWKAHPQLKVTLLSSGQLVDLNRLEADLAVRFVKPTQGELVSRRLSTTRFIACAHERLWPSLQGEAPKRWPWLGFIKDRAHPAEDKWMERHQIEPIFRASSWPTLLQAASCGLGAFWVSEQLLSIAPSLEGFVALPISPAPDFEITLWLVTHERLRQTPRINATWTWLEQIFASPRADLTR